MARKRKGSDTCCHRCRYNVRCLDTPTRTQTFCPYLPGGEACRAAQAGRRPFCSVCRGFKPARPRDPKKEPFLPGMGSTGTGKIEAVIVNPIKEKKP